MTTTPPAPRLSPLPIDQIDDAVRETIAATMSPESAADPSRILPAMATMLHHHELYRMQADLSHTLYKGALPRRVMKLILLRTAWTNKGAFVWSFHSQDAKKQFGFTVEDLERITVGSGADGWDELDRASVSAVEELQATGTIGDVTWEVLARHLNPKQLIEIPVLVGQMHGVIYTQNALQLPLIPGSPGLAAR